MMAIFWIRGPIECFDDASKLTDTFEVSGSYDRQPRAQRCSVRARSGGKGRWLAIPLCTVALWSCGGAGFAEARALRLSSPSAREPVAELRRVEVPTVPVERAALAAVPSMRADRVELAVAFPGAFDPAQEHPILITQVTADRSRPNVAELARYAPTALEQGYVVITAQGMPWPETPANDTLMHRYVTVRAALRWLAGEVPASEHWPIILAGFSGGAKISQVLAVSLTLEQRRVAGVFLGGCNEDHSQLLLGEYPTVKGRFAQIAFFLSAGTDDRIATPEAVRSVAEHLRRSGVQHLELSVHPGDHRLDPQDLSRALRWFRLQIQQQGGH
jgi:predicted esterase